MINISSLLHISENRKCLLHEENFAYVSPCDDLVSLISNFTITFPNSQIISNDYTILPHGSVTLILFNYHVKLQSFLFGPTTKPIKVGEIANKCSLIFIIEFQPAGFFPFTNINQKELSDQIIPFSLIHHSLDLTLRNILETSLSIDDVLHKIEETLLLSIRFLYPEEVAQAMKRIIQKEGTLPSTKIYDTLSYSPRHLNRLFNQYLGMSMKSFSRLVRVNKSLRLLNESKTTLALLCEQLGYYDVSHFVKDFKIVCGMTPQEYKCNMSNFYSEIAKY